MATSVAADGSVKSCSNCKRDIPAANFVMHEPHCKRNIVLCERCGEPVLKKQLDGHDDEFHAEVVCKCGKKMEKRFLEEHEARDCWQRLVKCEFCELELMFTAYGEHVEYCGSRTEKCAKCERFVQKKEQAFHDATACGGVRLPDDEVEEKRRIVVDVEIAPQAETRRTRRDGRATRNKQSSALTMHVQPDSTKLPVNVRAAKKPVAATVAAPVAAPSSELLATSDSDYAWQVSQDINGLNVQPEKKRLHSLDVEELIARDVESAYHHQSSRPLHTTLSPGQPSKSSQTTGLLSDLQFGQSFVVPEGETMAGLIADQQEWERLYGNGQQHFEIPGLNESSSGSSYASETEKQMADDFELAQRLQQESVPVFDALEMSDYNRRQQEDAMRRHEREQEKKREEKGMAEQEKRRKQMEDDEALAQQLQAQEERESLLYGRLQWQDRREEGRQREEATRQEQERRKQRQLGIDEELARQLQMDEQTESHSLDDRFDSEASDIDPMFLRETQRSSFPNRRGFRYSNNNGIDLGTTAGLSRRPTQLDDRHRRYSSTDELVLQKCRHCKQLQLPSRMDEHERTCDKKKYVGVIDASSSSVLDVSRTSAASKEQLTQTRRHRESPFGVDGVVPRSQGRFQSQDASTVARSHSPKDVSLDQFTEHKRQGLYNGDSVNPMSLLQSSRMPTSDIKLSDIACRYCQRRFPLDKLLNPQLICSNKPGSRTSCPPQISRSMSYDESDRPCRSCLYCDQTMPLRLLNEHERQCQQKRIRRRDSPVLAARASKGAVNGRPCIHCRNLIELADLRQHQLECKENKVLSTLLRNDLLGYKSPTSTVAESKPSSKRSTAVDMLNSRQQMTNNSESRSLVSTKQDPSRLVNRQLRNGSLGGKELGVSQSLKSSPGRYDLQQSNSPLSFGERPSLVSVSSQHPKSAVSDRHTHSSSTMQRLRRSNSFTYLSRTSQPHDYTSPRDSHESHLMGQRKSTTSVSTRYSKPLTGRQFSSTKAKEPWR